MMLEQLRTEVADRIELRRRLARECPELLSGVLLAQLREVSLRSVQIAQMARFNDCDRSARQAGGQPARLINREAAEYSEIEVLIQREVRKLELDQSLGGVAEPAEKSILKTGSDGEPLLKLMATVIGLIGAVIAAVALLNFFGEELP